MIDYIEIKGAKIHNLKNIDVKIPKNKLTIITGVSGSGKSSLAFDTLYEESKRRYLIFSGTSFMIDSAPSFNSMTGLSPAIAVEQRIIRQSNPRSTVGTRTKLNSLLAILFAQYGKRNPEYDDGLPLSMEMFQKNSPKGMCVKCLGSGKSFVVNEEKLFENKERLLSSIIPEVTRCGTGKRFKDFCNANKLNIRSRFCDLNDEEKELLIYGDGGKTIFNGVIPWLLRSDKLDDVSGRQRYLYSKAELTKVVICSKCNGSGLGIQATNVTIAGKTITELENMYIKDLYDLLITVEIEHTQFIKEILTKLECMIDVGLHHLALSRPIPTLSGGEIQRLFLASFIIADMDSIVFVFDEPTIGLHEVEKEKLVEVIKNLVKRGNTVVAVEHDLNFIRSADYIIDLGPYAGVNGGKKIFEGTYDEFLLCNSSNTAPYLLSNENNLVNHRLVNLNKILKIENAIMHNLQNITVEIPLGIMVGIAGVSGSGKSSLIADTLVPKLKEMLKNKCIIDEENFEEIDVIVSGIQYIKKCLIIDQKPIGRSKTSCPATYTGVFDRIRTLYAKETGLPIGMFSVNSKGKCSICKGDGEIHYYVGFGNYIDIECEACGGTGFVEEALNAIVDGKNIKDVLKMTVDEAIIFFKNKDKIITNILNMLLHVGMGYITLGQKTPTISGGESQRIKLAKELAKGNNTKDCVYILDEPTTGLSFYDSKNLMKLLHELVNKGNTIIVTEHDPYILSNCDYIIELGPGGGSDGGYVIATGSPNELKDNKKSIIGKYLL